MTLLQAKFEPPGLTAPNRYQFSCRNQQEGEPIDEYVCVLQELADKCDFGEFLPHALKDRLIPSVKYLDIRSKLLGIVNPTWERTMEVTLQEEQVKLQAKVLAYSTNIHEVHPSYRQRSKPARPQIPPIQHSPKPEAVKQPVKKFSPCHRCGKLRDVNTCPAINWTCHKCQKKGQAASVCRSSRSTGVHVVQQQESTVPAEESPEEEAVCPPDCKHVTVIQTTSLLTTGPSTVREKYKYLHCEMPEPLVISEQDCEYPDSIIHSEIPCIPSTNPTFVDAMHSTITSPVCSDTDEDLVWVKDVTKVNFGSDSPALYSNVWVEGQFFKMEVDNGSGALLMAQEDFEKLWPDVLIRPSNVVPWS